MDLKPIIDALKEANPGRELCSVKVPDQDPPIRAIAKIPDDAEYKRFRTQQAVDGQGPVAIRTLVVTNVLKAYEGEGDDLEEVPFGALLRRRPGIVDTIGGKLISAAGVSAAATVEKL